MKPRPRAGTKRAKRPARRRTEAGAAPASPSGESSGAGGDGIECAVRNAQRAWRIDTGRLHRLAVRLLRDEMGLERAVFGVQLIGARAMARLNWRWLRHEGSTDILTFEHEAPAGPGSEPSEPGREPTRRIAGECYISVDDAVRQAAEFGTTADLELVRYVVHGALHLAGFDDLEPVARRRMKREENRLVRRLARSSDVIGLVRRGTRGRSRGT